MRLVTVELWPAPFSRPIILRTSRLPGHKFIEQIKPHQAFWGHSFCGVPLFFLTSLLSNPTHLVTLRKCRWGRGLPEKPLCVRFLVKLSRGTFSSRGNSWLTLLQIRELTPACNVVIGLRDTELPAQWVNHCFLLLTRVLILCRKAVCPMGGNDPCCPKAGSTTFFNN